MDKEEFRRQLLKHIDSALEDADDDLDFMSYWEVVMAKVEEDSDGESSDDEG